MQTLKILGTVVAVFLAFTHEAEARPNQMKRWSGGQFGGLQMRQQPSQWFAGRQRR